MTIRDPNAYLRRILDFSLYDDVFSHGIGFTDIDGAVERNGIFLILEDKSLDATIPQGQLVFYKQLHRLGQGKILIIFQYGRTTDKPEYIRVIFTNRFGSPELSRLIPCNLDLLREVIRQWYNAADSGRSMTVVPN